MTGKCIFKCEVEGTTYRVMARPFKQAVRGVMYFDYVGTKRLSRNRWFNKEYAIECVLRDALGTKSMVLLKQII